MMHVATPTRHTTGHDTPLGESPSTGRVLLPADLMAAERLSATDLAVWALLAEQGRSEGSSQVRQTLMRRLGDVDAHRVGSALGKLERRGWLKVTRSGDSTPNVYEPLGTITPDDPRPWVELTADHLDALAAGAIRPYQLLTLARWLSLTHDGWTDVTLPEFRRRFGGSVREAKAARAALVAAGLLEVRRRADDHVVTAAPGRLPAALAAGAQA